MCLKALGACLCWFRSSFVCSLYVWYFILFFRSIYFVLLLFVFCLVCPPTVSFARPECYCLVFLLQIDYDSKLSTSHLRRSSGARRRQAQNLAASHPVRCFVACFRGDLTAIRRYAWAFYFCTGAHGTDYRSQSQGIDLFFLAVHSQLL